MMMLPLSTAHRHDIIIYDDYMMKSTHNGTQLLWKNHQPRPAIYDDCLTDDDWSVLTEYLAILKPFKMATTGWRAEQSMVSVILSSIFVNNLAECILHRRIWRSLEGTSYNRIATKGCDGLC
jgi:hypothetical protein